MSYYYADGENALIRVAVEESDQPDLAALQAAPAQRYVVAAAGPTRVPLSAW